MANLLIPGTFYDYLDMGEYKPVIPGYHHEFGWLFWAGGLQKWTIADTLDADGLPQLGTCLGGWGAPGVGAMVLSAASFKAVWSGGTYFYNGYNWGFGYPITKNMEVPEVSPGLWKIALADPAPGKEYNPINGEGYGNERDGINRWWAFKSDFVGFTYQPGQYIKMTDGSSRCLVYIGGRKVFHGGVGMDPNRAVNLLDLDTLGLEAGRIYSMRIFCAVGGLGEATPMRFHFETNIPIQEEFMVALSQWIIGSGTITPAAGAFVPGVQTITATPSDGYQLATLTLNGAAISSGDSVDLQDHATIAAVFTRLQKNIHTCTRDEIIAAALRKCQVLAEGELPTNDQISTGAEALERFMHHSQSDCEFRWQFLQRTQAVAAGEQAITLTGSEDVLDVYDLFLRDANGMDTPLRLVDAHWYDETLPCKSTSDALPAVALATFNRDPDTNVASVGLSIYPKPAQAYTLYYRAMIKHYLLENGTDEANFDEMWCEVVVYGLAARLADEYNRTERAVYLEQKFEKLKDAAKRKTGASRDSLIVFSV